MSAQAHYAQHLARIYAWMAGDFATKQKEFAAFLEAQNIAPALNRTALDLGAGHGIQSTVLAQKGFTVTAFDFNQHLLELLKANGKGLNIKTVQDNIENVLQYAPLQPELLVCWGDTLTHLEDAGTIKKFIADCCGILPAGGKLLLSFRDYTQALEANARFIPVKSDDERILTCFLEYSEHHVTVTDLLHEKGAKGWEQKASAYKKVRVSPALVQAWLNENRMEIIFEGVVSRMVGIVAVKR